MPTLVKRRLPVSADQPPAKRFRYTAPVYNLYKTHIASGPNKSNAVIRSRQSELKKPLSVSRNVSTSLGISPQTKKFSYVKGTAAKDLKSAHKSVSYVYVPKSKKKFSANKTVGKSTAD